MAVAKGQERPWQYVITSPVLLDDGYVLNTSISRYACASAGRQPVHWTEVIDSVGLVVGNVAQENRKIKTQQTCISEFAGIKRGVLCHVRECFVMEGGN